MKLRRENGVDTLKLHHDTLFKTLEKPGCDACKKKNVRCNRKATFYYKGKLQEVSRAGLNEIEYDYADSKQHFYLQYHVAATDMKALCKKQTTLQAAAYLGFTAPGDKISLIG